MVLKYAEGGSFNNGIKKDLGWCYDLHVLRFIIGGLRNIHERKMVHRDFHTGNILLYGNHGSYISDMGLCGEVGDVDPKNIYGVMPYVSPEVLLGKPYTQAADIYSFGMIMYFIATGRQPFSDRAHDQPLVLSICNRITPEITGKEVPECYIDLMKECWDPNPENRPNTIEMERSIRSEEHTSELQSH